MSICTPTAPDAAAMYHAGYSLASVRPGGLRDYTCRDCKGTWQQNRKDDEPPMAPPEAMSYDATRIPAETEQDDKVVTTSDGFDPNQLLIDSMNRVKSGKTVWVATIEIGADGVPLVSWSGGQVTYPAAAAAAMQYEVQSLLHRTYEAMQLREDEPE